MLTRVDGDTINQTIMSLTSNDPPGADVDGFKVSFFSSNPKTAMKVAERRRVCLWRKT